MKKIFVGILVGVGIGFFLFSRKASTPENSAQAYRVPVENVNPLSRVPIEVVKPNSPVEKTAEALNEPKREVSAVQTSPAQDVSETSLPEARKTHLLDFDISEEQIAEMEENLPDLQKEVSLFRDTTGWIVRFHSQNNLLSQIGIRDNDLIRFGQIEKLKQDPSKTALISRLEAVIENLQR